MSAKNGGDGNDKTGGDVVELDAHRKSKGKKKPAEVATEKKEKRTPGRLEVPFMTQPAKFDSQNDSPYRPGTRGPTPTLQPDATTLEQIRRLASMQLTQTEIAAVLLVAGSTFKKFLADVPEARNAYEMGQGQGCASVRRSQFVMAHRSATMAIWWGKQYLGQADKIETDNNHQVQHEWMNGTAEDFERKLRMVADRIKATQAPLIEHEPNPTS